MGSVTEIKRNKVPSAPHTFDNGVEGKVCGAVRRVKIVPACGKWKPISEYWRSQDYEDEKNCLCTDCCKAWTISKKDGRAYSASDAHGGMSLRDLMPVVFDDLSTTASVGWYGEVQYFPITPLLGLTTYASEMGLIAAIRNDPVLRDLLRKFLVNSSRGAPLWHLPWSHFSIFITKYGNEQTKPQQDRVQKVIEAAFGHTAESNRDAAAQIDREPIITPQSDSADAVDLIKNGVLSLFGPAIEMLVLNAVSRALSEHKGTTPDEDKEILDNTRVVREGIGGVLILEKEKEVKIEVDRLINGTAYIFVNRSVHHPTQTGLIMISVGEVMDARSLPEVVRDTLRADRYNGAKHGGTWASWRAFHTDNRKKAQDINHKLVLKAGGERERGRLDVFWVTERILDDFLLYPGYLRADDIGAYAEKACLFRTPMEVYI